MQLIILILLSGISGLGFVAYNSKQDALNWSNKCLFQSFDANAEQKLRKWELILTDNSFVRFRKTYMSGKQEYYSFNLRRFNELDYLGTTEAGSLHIKTLTDDIIVQTYNDPKGNVDSMSTELSIPVKDMSAERIDSLRSAFLYLKAQ